ncbi:hypothetical protein FA15DRAFT_559539, partial [Coprinopsis marcescibilis]
LLRLVLPASGPDEEDRYAFTRCPETYEDAVKAAVDTLGPYMVNATTDNVVLRVSHEVKGKKHIWAEIRRQDWDVICQEQREIGPENWRVLSPLYRAVGVFLDVDSTFANGKVWLVCATFSRHGILWAPISAQKDGAGKYGTTLTSRPNSYQGSLIVL